MEKNFIRLEIGYVNALQFRAIHGELQKSLSGKPADFEGQLPGNRLQTGRLTKLG
jgi:hypothetical protein